MWHPFRRERAKIVFSSDYIYGLPTVGDHQTFDLMKYKKIRDKLIEEGALRRRDILRPRLCPYDDLRLVHTESYLKSLQDPVHVSNLLRLTEVDLFYNSILEYYRAVTGGTLLATAYALRWNIPTFNFGGGYHHAHPDKAEGFCLINDVAVAIQKFRNRYKYKKFMIIDLDYHQGNGNLLYFKDDPNVYTFSMHADNWVEIDRPTNRDILLPEDISDDTYLDILCRELDKVCQSFQPQAVFYIAGSDPYEKDTLADMKISRQGMLKRNLLVYQKVRKKGIPLITLAGGGYGTESWEVYYDFIKFCLVKKVTEKNFNEYDCSQINRRNNFIKNLAINPSDKYPLDMINKKYWHIAKRLTTAQLQKTQIGEDFSDLDMYNINIGNRGHSLFLGYYSREGLELVFEKYNVYNMFEKKGYKNVKLQIDTADPFVHKLTIFENEKSQKTMLCEMVLKREPLIIEMPFKTELNGKTFNGITIEWLAMQSPKDSFTRERPRLPGQKYPGLGLASKVLELLLIAAWRLKLAGLLNNPEHYHNAHLYSRIFYYISPVLQGKLRALERDLQPYPLHMSSWAIEYGAVIDRNTGKAAEWQAGKQIVPLDRELKKLFDSADYREVVKQEMGKNNYYLDLQLYEKSKNRWRKNEA